mmetsp:Transcript_22711/g.69810  ORF Transcript_22711/g.69810 Transcript_22711/m.69810 type:complete len:91 (+) Transcript_22711:2760-3032(+)
MRPIRVLEICHGSSYESSRKFCSGRRRTPLLDSPVVILCVFSPSKSLFMNETPPPQDVSQEVFDAVAGVMNLTEDVEDEADVQSYELTVQ